MPQGALRSSSLVLGDRWVVTLSGLASLFIGYFLFFYTPSVRIRQQNVPVGVLTSQGGAVKRRHAGSLRWGIIKREGVVYLRDTVFVPKEARSIITFNNKQKIELEPNSMIQFDEVNSDRIEITLMEGKAKATEGEITVKKEASSKITAPAVFKATRILLYLGETTELEKEQMALKSAISAVVYKSINIHKDRLNIREANLLLDRLEHFEIRPLRPVKNARFNLRGTSWIEFIWKPIPLDGVTYVLEVSRMPEFKRFLSYPSKVGRLSMQFVDESDYYWRVRVKRNRENRLSDVFRFAMTQQGGGSSIAASRLPSAQISLYKTEIALDEKFAKVIFRSTNVEERCPEERLKKGTYYCRVIAAQGGKVVKTYTFEKE